MFSGVIAWFYKYLLGICPSEEAPGFERIDLKPNFIKELGYVRGTVNTVKGEIRASWHYENGIFSYEAVVPDGVDAYFEGLRLQVGENRFVIGEEK